MMTTGLTWTDATTGWSDRKKGKDGMLLLLRKQRKKTNPITVRTSETSIDIEPDLSIRVN